jgi:hypothetical protein
MSYNGHTVIDMDSHIRQYWDLDRTYKPYMDSKYRETYRQFSEAANSLKRKAGDRGFSEFLWPAPPTRPLGIYDAYELHGNGNSQSEETNSGDRASTNAGVRIDPACNWDPAIRLRDMGNRCCRHQCDLPELGRQFLRAARCRLRGRPAPGIPPVHEQLLR